VIDYIPRAQFDPPAVVVCGETLIDLIQQGDGSFRAVPGGSPHNTATALGRWGVRPALLSRVGQDHFGALIRAGLTRSGVDLSLVANTREPTSLAVATLDAAGSASYSFYVDGCADGTWSAEALPEFSPQAHCCIIAGSFALAVPAMAAAFERLFEREANRLLVFDPNVRPVLVGERAPVEARFDRWISRSTIVKASAEDVHWRHPDVPLADVAQRWLQTGPSLVVITEGARGSRAFTRDVALSRPAPTVAVVDTVGAGDTFTAGLVEWLLGNDVRTPDAIRELTPAQLESAIDAATAVAADTCTRPGADPPWRTARPTS
jgi:fructokinase